MALKTKIIVQQILNIDDTTTTASKYPKYTVVLGNSISSITAGELTAAVEAAAGSAAAAKDSEIAAKDSENKAKDSEIQAGIHADASEASATQSAASAAESERQANLSQGSAENSAASALESKNFKDASELAAQNAEQSKILAEQAQRAAEAAQSGAQASENKASAFATQAAASSASAGDFAAAAKQSELNAKTSETNAATSEVEAETQAETATTEANRAKAEADRAAQIVDSKLDKEDISGFIKVYKTKEEADTDVSSRVLGEKILVWNQTDSKYGWYKVAGTAETPVLELVETEQKLVSINNVRADDAGNVQITLPGGNPSLWLGEVTWFPYDKDSGVGYPGVLPADGREVLRVDYPDTWEAIEAGLIPSVTEEQWQAGATLYFSTGNGTTTFRLPDMMQGQAFRAAAKGEENAGNIKEQIPYITMINGKAPADDGTITLGNAADKNVWNGVEGEVLLRGAFGLGGTGLILNEPDAVSFFKAMRAFGSGYYRNDSESNPVIPKYSAGFYSKTADTHTFICSAYGNGVTFVATINDALLDGENPTIHTNTLYGTVNKPDLNTDTQGVLGIEKGGTGSNTQKGARLNLDTPVGSRAIGMPNNSDVLAFMKSSAESGYYSSGSIVTGVPEIAGWYMFDLHVHGRNASGEMDHGNVYCTTDVGAIWYTLMWAGVWQPWRRLTTEHGIIPITSGGTGTNNANDARINLGLGPANAPTFSGLTLPGTNGVNSGIAVFSNRNSDGTQLSYSRMYHEIQNGIGKTTIQTTREGGATNYFQIDEYGNVGNVNSITTSAYLGIGTASALGGKSIVLGDSDTGLQWVSDGIIKAIANSAQIFAWTPSSIDTYMTISSHVDNSARGLYVNGIRTTGASALIAGVVEAGSHVGWRDRASGMLVELNTRGAAANIWKATRWGDQHAGASDIVIYDDGSPYYRTLVGGGEFGFNGLGQATCTSWISTSDIRLKAQLKEIVSAKDKVKSLQGYTYFKRNSLVEDEHSFYCEEAGLIAQDVQTVLPEAVYKIANSDLLGVNYSGVTALLANAVKEMLADAEAQEARISNLEEELAELKALVATLVNK